MDKYLVERRDSREIEGDELEWGLTSDGWNYRELDEIGVMKFLDGIDNIEYELKNARRGSYAKFGDTIKDLTNRFKKISHDANMIVSELKKIQ